MNARCVKVLLSFVLIVVFALGIVPLAGAQEGPKPEAVGLRPDAPPYALHGPYWVGARDFVIDPDSERPLTITVWYPALNTAGLPEETVYEIFADCMVRVVFSDNADWTIKGHAIMDAAPDMSHAPYPLVIFSHGAGGWRQESPYLVEHLASFGFVVVAMDHPAEAPVADMYWQGFVLRPNDVRRTLDYAEALSASGAAMESLIDLDDVAVAGVSLGGHTALALAGAQIDWAGFLTMCEQHPESLPEEGACAAFASHTAELATLAGLDEVPAGLWPPTGDSRIDAVISLSGEADIFGSAGMASVSVPLLAIGGSADRDSPPEWNLYPMYENSSSANKALVVFEEGNHTLVMEACTASPWMSGIGLFYLCSDLVWDMDRAHDLINHFTTAFLLATLKNDAEAAAALAPDAVQFPGIIYEATGFQPVTAWANIRCGPRPDICAY